MQTQSPIVCRDKYVLTQHAAPPATERVIGEELFKAPAHIDLQQIVLGRFMQWKAGGSCHWPCLPQPLSSDILSTLFILHTGTQGKHTLTPLKGLTYFRRQFLWTTQASGSNGFLSTSLSWLHPVSLLIDFTFLLSLKWQETKWAKMKNYAPTTTHNRYHPEMESPKSLPTIAASFNLVTGGIHPPLLDIWKTFPSWS